VTLFSSSTFRHQQKFGVTRPKISTNPTEIFAFVRLSGDFGRAVTSGSLRFDKDRRDP
jgi:hypothetical protein